MILNKPLRGMYDGKDVEAQLKQYMDMLNEYCDGEIYKPEKTIKKRVEIPEFTHNNKTYSYDIPLNGPLFKSLPKKHQNDIGRFWNEQRSKIRNGDGEVCGLQYKHFNFTRLHGAKTEGGRVNYRRHENFIHSLIEECLWGDRKGQGIVLAGRRRSGKSSIMGNTAVEVCSRIKDATITMTSKTEEDAQEVLINQKVRHIAEHLPFPLRPSILRNNKGTLHFGKHIKDQGGNKVVGGRNTQVLGKTPKPTSVEGQTNVAWFHDEAGKTRNFKKLVDMTLPSLNDADGFEREGFFFAAGVAGEMEDMGFINVWEAADELDLIKVVILGWMGMEYDEYGNEDVEKAVRKILKKRNAILNSKTMKPQEKKIALARNQQQYPLTEDEIFQLTGKSKFNLQNINAQSRYLAANEYDMFYGDLEWTIRGMVANMTPSPTGRFCWIEPPMSGYKYVSGGDVYGLKQGLEGSIGVQWIYKLKNNELSPGDEEELLAHASKGDFEERMKALLAIGDLPVGLHMDDGRDPAKFAEDCAKFCCWYWKGSGVQEPVKFLPETEPSNVLSHFLDHFPSLLMNMPINPKKKITNADLFEKFGISKKEYEMELMLKLLKWYTDIHCAKIYFPELLEKMPSYDETSKQKKWDIVDSFGNTLIMRDDFRIKEWNKKPVLPVEELDEDILGDFYRV